MKKIRLFPEITRVSRTQRIQLYCRGLINEKDIPVGWVKLSQAMRDGEVDPAFAKMLILLEIQRGAKHARTDIIHRLVTFITKDEREQLEDKIKKLLK